MHRLPELPTLSSVQMESFVENGFVRVDEAFPRAVADQVREILWRDTGCDRNDPRTWTRPQVRLNAYSAPPFLAAAGTPPLTAAYDQLVGAGRWHPLDSMATFPIRFPSLQPSGDVDWHVDMSFGPATSDTLRWRANLVSEGRALLMLFLFSDVDHDDAPTRLRAGSHLDVARLLAEVGPEGLSLADLIDADFGRMGFLREELAVGPAGTVYLCHPFLVHAGQDGPRRPRFMGQPALVPVGPLRLDGDIEALAPVEQAIRRALHGTGPVGTVL